MRKILITPAEHKELLNHPGALGDFIRSKGPEVGDTYYLFVSDKFHKKQKLIDFVPKKQVKKVK